MRVYEPLFVEMLQSNGACDIGCSHCANGQTASSETLTYGAKALEMFQLLQEYRESVDDRISSLRLSVGGGKRIFEEALPIKYFPRNISFSFGKIPEFKGNDDILRTVKQCVDAINSCLDGVEIGIHPSTISCAFSPRLNEKLEFAEIEGLVLFYRALITKIFNETNKRWEQIELHMVDNRVPKKSFQDNEIEPVDHCKTLAMLNLIIETSLSGVPVTATSMSTRTFDRQTNFSVLKHSAIGPVFAISRRLLFPPDSYSSETELNTDLVLSLLPDEVWVQHSTVNTRDKSVRLSYDDVEGIVKNAMKSGELIRKEILSLVRKRREKKLAVL